ncbi:MAG: ABC transporter ATP-binding protein [Rhodospirillales bacterium]|nr:ABC transporter ATP-binding protein [Rhodospirillales bacterium]
MSELPLLEVRNLHLTFDLYEGKAHVLNGVDITIRNGERVGLVGESGCGKSIMARAILGLAARSNIEMSGEIRYHGANLFGLGPQAWRGLRGRKMSMIFQDPVAALNPVFTIEDQMIEVVRRGDKAKSRKEAIAIAIAALRQVAIDEPERVLASYPFQLSGGMNQRVIISMALVNEPELVFADEPGTSLDVTVQEQTLRLMTRLTKDVGAAVLLIAHNLGVVREFCERVYVMYAGMIVEEGPVKELFANPKHPYTQALFSAVPKLTGEGLPKSIDGMIPDYTHAPEGCRFHPRCPHVRPECLKPPPFVTVGPDHRARCILYTDAGAKEPAHV